LSTGKNEPYSDTDQRSLGKGQSGGNWAEMYHYFNFRKVEISTALPQGQQRRIHVLHDEREFGDSIRSKTDTAMVNEVLCKVLCHNLVVLIHEMYELGVDLVFWRKETVQ